jgi:general secretion pathway protein B
MSYILDALRRADAERERGGVPGLHTQAMPDLGDDERPARARGLQPWHWVVIGLIGGLAVAVAWQWSGSEAPPPAASLPPPPIAAAALPADPPAAVPAPVQTPPPAPVPVATAPTAPPSVAPAIAPMRATPAPESAAAASAPAAPAPQRLASLAELPAELRAGLPPLAFGGSIYSDTPANRLLIVNGQLLHEGDALGPGARLEQIKPKAAVINIRGQRFEIGL